MKSSLKSATKAEKRRFMRLQDVGCIACRIAVGTGGIPSDIHHILSGGRRISHSATLPLCCWHHRGLPVGDMDIDAMDLLLGPSLALSKRRFINRFGTEMELLEMVNKILSG